jgi:GNAT superfamily N-acetyltransferase
VQSPADPLLLERLQAQMRSVARRQYEAVAVPPFTLFFHPTDPLPFFNYAIPDDATAGTAELSGPLARLASEFRERRRLPRFEFVETSAPRLAEALERNGYLKETRAQLMICARGDERAAPDVPGVEVERLDASSPDPLFALFLEVQRRAFGIPSPRAASLEDVAALRQTLGGGLALLARHGGQAVATAMIQPSEDGLAELVGVATLEAFRKRGIGGLLSSEAVRAAFAGSTTLAFLSAADARAGRVYEAVGFVARGHMLFYRDPGEAEPAIEIREALEEQELAWVRGLVLSHAAALGAVPGVERVTADAARLPGPFAPPSGALLVATLGGAPAGCVAFRRIDEGTCEIKRMFVDPAFRKRGVARALMHALLSRARERGYGRVRLGTLHTMTAAQALYRDLGFVEIPRYRENDDHIDTMFFERVLG